MTWSLNARSQCQSLSDLTVAPLNFAPETRERHVQEGLLGNATQGTWVVLLTPLRKNAPYGWARIQGWMNPSSTL